jgi:hypothetical protein
VGVTLPLCVFLKHATGEGGEAFVGTINARLIDVGPTGTQTEIYYGELNYISGIDPTKGAYTYKIPTPFEMLKGHHLRVEISTLHSQYSTTMRFYYGDVAYPAGFTLDTFERAGSGSIVPVLPKPKPRVLPRQLPATGVGTSYLLAVFMLGSAVILGRSLAKRRV